MLLVTLKITVQLLFAGIVIPVKLRAVWFAVNEEGVVPTQVPVTAPPTALIFAKVSVNAPPVRADALLLERVSVTTEVRAGLNGGRSEPLGDGRRSDHCQVGRVADRSRGWGLGGGDARGGVWMHTRMVLVTLKITVQLLLAGIVIPVKLSAVAPADSVPGVVPAQVPVTAPPTAVIFAKRVGECAACQIGRIAVGKGQGHDRVLTGLNGGGVEGFGDGRRTKDRQVGSIAGRSGSPGLRDRHAGGGVGLDAGYTAGDGKNDRATAGGAEW